MMCQCLLGDINESLKSLPKWRGMVFILCDVFRDVGEMSVLTMWECSTSHCVGV